MKKVVSLSVDLDNLPSSGPIFWAHNKEIWAEKLTHNNIYIYSILLFYIYSTNFYIL